MMKTLILAILAHFWPVFGMLWLPYQCSKLSMSIFDLALTRLSENSEKILSNNDLFHENADSGHFRLFLACFLPIKTLVSVSKALKEFVSLCSDWIECDWPKNS